MKTLFGLQGHFFGLYDFIVEAQRDIRDLGDLDPLKLFFHLFLKQSHSYMAKSNYE